MCTVTFIPEKHTVYLTSNRDEKPGRSQALPPAIYEGVSGKMLFPKDGDAGGSWIAAHENGNAIVFLNGGFFPHIPNPPYRKSRGIVLLDLLDCHHPYNSFHTVEFLNIEPFTAIIWDDHQLYECRWDSKQKHVLSIDERRPHIWSSVTLYDPEIIAKRKKWFEQWIKKNKTPSQEDILNFHQFTGDGDKHNDLMMNRGKVYTVSVTSLEISDDCASMRYLDSKKNQAFQQKLTFEKSMAGNNE